MPNGNSYLCVALPRPLRVALHRIAQALATAVADQEGGEGGAVPPGSTGGAGGGDPDQQQGPPFSFRPMDPSGLHMTFFFHGTRLSSLPALEVVRWWGWWW